MSATPEDRDLTVAEKMSFDTTMIRTPPHKPDWADLEAANLYTNGPIAAALRAACRKGAEEMREAAKEAIDQARWAGPTDLREIASIVGALPLPGVATVTAESRIERVASAMRKFIDEAPLPAMTHEAISAHRLELAAVAIRAHEAALAEDGYEIVPIHPTTAMQGAAASLAGCKQCDGFGDDIHQNDIWRVMLDAAKDRP